jgi:methionine-rich copper-binding protein CopC
LLKHSWTLTVILAIVVVPALAFSADNQIVVSGKITANADRTVTVPLEVTNQNNLAAIDIPLKFSEGVTLKEVNFENTRVSYFDLKVARIDQPNRTVVIGLLPQMTPTHKPDLVAGTGVVANLVFEVNDPTVTEITFEPVTLENPHHSPLFVYHQLDAGGKITGQRREVPEIKTAALALSDGSTVPQTYALRQNYPNPFNPTTEIAFDLPAATRVSLVVYNVLGQEVRTLVDGQLDAGSHTVQWNGTNNAGQQVSSGIYFYRLSSDRFNDTKKMLMLK